MNEYTYKRAIGKKCIGKSDFAYMLDDAFSKVSEEDLSNTVCGCNSVYVNAHRRGRVGCCIRTQDKTLFQEMFNSFYETGKLSLKY